jgi:hypothetical protein
MPSTEQSATRSAPRAHAPVADATPGADGDESARLGTSGVKQSGGAPSRLMADLVRAMRAAAEESRAGTVEALRVEARELVDGAGERSASGEGALRRAAEDDIQAIRDWSEAEMARVRAEADDRIAAREASLEREVADHATRAGTDAAAVDAAVASFEAELDAFFSRLSTIDDPAEFAAVAAALPEPPALDQLRAPVVVAGHANESMDEAPDLHRGGRDAWPAADVTVAGTVVSPNSSDPQDADDVDPRLAALGLAGRVDAADAEAFPAAEDAQPIEELDGEDLSARLAGLVPDVTAPTNGSAAPSPAPVADDTDTDAPTEATRVVVTGLVNVASIASFKRHLARVRGVVSVTVSSGPDGEFVFTAHHVPAVSLRDVVPALPGFAARVTGVTEGTFTVSARDPESDS